MSEVASILKQRAERERLAIAVERRRRECDARRVLARTIAADFADQRVTLIVRADPLELARWAVRLHVALVGLLNAERLG